MKIPDTFLPEKPLDKNTENLMVSKKVSFTPTYASLDKVVFDNLSFKQLRELVRLNDKIYELKISFEYKKINHDIIFASYSERSSGRGSLKLMQHHPHDHLVLEELIGHVEQVAIFSDRLVVSYAPNDHCCSEAEFLPKRFADPSKKIEQFFDADWWLNGLDFPFLVETKIHVEYRGLTDAEYSRYVNLS